MLESIKYILYVSDMPRAVKFYSDLFGLSEKLVTEHWSELTFGDAIVALHGGGDGSHTKTGLGFQMSDINATCEQIAAAGGKIVREPERRPEEPIILALVADPDNNEIMVSQYVGQFE